MTNYGLKQMVLCKIRIDSVIIFAHLHWASRIGATKPSRIESANSMVQFHHNIRKLVANSVELKLGETDWLLEKLSV